MHSLIHPFQSIPKKNCQKNKKLQIFHIKILASNFSSSLSMHLALSQKHYKKIKKNLKKWHFFAMGWVESLTANDDDNPNTNTNYQKFNITKKKKFYM